jgi:hypothetical protein
VSSVKRDGRRARTHHRRYIDSCPMSQLMSPRYLSLVVTHCNCFAIIRRWIAIWRAEAPGFLRLFGLFHLDRRSRIRHIADRPLQRPYPRSVHARLDGTRARRAGPSDRAGKAARFPLELCDPGQETAGWRRCSRSAQSLQEALDDLEPAVDMGLVPHEKRIRRRRRIAREMLPQHRRSPKITRPDIARDRVIPQAR